MSGRGFPIHFDNDPPLDRVTLAVVPVDTFSGQPVTSGVKALVRGQLARPIKNLSGRLVFINLPVQERYGVTVDASKAGYFSPGDTEFPDPDDPEAKKSRRHLIRLMRRPDFAYDGTTRRG